MTKTDKRPLEGSGDFTRNAKRPNIGNEPLLKLLVPSYVAGALIGKGGSALADLKEQYGGSVRLSAGKEYYPGTQERVVVVTGANSELVNINNHIMVKVEDPGRDSTMKDVTIIPGRSDKVLIVLTDSAAGLLIGRAGASIKAIQEESQAKLSITTADKAIIKGERLLTITGTFEQRIAACNQVIEKISCDGSNMANTVLRYDTAMMDVLTQSPGALGYAGYDSVHGGNLNLDSGAPLDAKVTVEVNVSEVLVGPIMGKGGSIVKDMVQRSGGARFKFSDKSDNGEDRTLTITGNMRQAQMAYNLLSERMTLVQNDFGPK